MNRSILISIVLIELWSCNAKIAAQKSTVFREFKKEETVGKINGNEDFAQFSKLFYTDSLFQMSRIKFPLKGERNIDVPITATNVMGDSIVSGWRKKDWRMLTNTYFSNNDSIMIIGSDKYIRKTNISNKSAIVYTYIEDSGFSVREKFALKKGKWYLIFFSTLSY